MSDSTYFANRDPVLGLRTRQLTLKQYFVFAIVVSLLLGAYVSVQRLQRPSRFLNAAKAGDAESLTRLLNGGFDVHYQDGWRTSALMLASSHGHANCVKLLIDQGANPNERSRENATPLMWAAESGSIQVVQVLLNRGSDLELRDDNGFSAFDYARQNRQYRIADLLIGPDVQPKPDCPVRTTESSVRGKNEL